jgi:hypothetical protein
MNLISGIQNWLKPSHNIREVIPGWDDDYPDPMFCDDWSLTSEIDLSDDNCNWTLNEWVDDLKTNDINGIFDDYFESDNEEYNFKAFTDEQEKFIDLTRDCWDCKYYHGVTYHGIDLICSLHPNGNKNCPDFESKY